MAKSAESFQLLQLSDDLKSLSDLELPELLPQRKRKVRRKVRSRPNQRYNPEQTDDNVKLNCKYVSIWMCVTVACAWMFLLSYILGIVHSECHELTKDVKKLSAICLSMPETLQKLHESYKFLEQNQTAISQKIYEIQQRIESVEKEFLQFKENIRKKEDGPDGDKTVDVKDTVAGFGAKIQSLESDVKTLKDDFTGIQQTQQKDKDLLGSLRVTVDTIANSSQSSTATGTQNASNVWMRNFTDQCSNDLKNVSNQLAAINQTFSLKIKAMDDEMHDHQTKLDGLNESFANVSSHVTSIESEWPKFKQANQKYDSAIAEMINDIFTLKSSVVNISSAIHNVQSEQENANKKITNFANINDSVPVSASSQLNGSQPNLNDSKVTSFPDSLINPKDSATQQKSSENVSQPPQQPKSSATQSPSSSTTTPIHMAN